FGLPDDDAAVLAACCEILAVWTERNDADRFMVRAGRLNGRGVEVVKIPDANAAVLAASHTEVLGAALGRAGNGRHVRGMGELLQRADNAALPYDGILILAGGYEPRILGVFEVVANGNAGDLAPMTHVVAFGRQILARFDDNLESRPQRVDEGRFDETF